MIDHPTFRIGELLMNKKTVCRCLPCLLSAGLAYLSAFVLSLMVLFAGSYPNPDKLQPLALLTNSGFQIMCFVLMMVFYRIYSLFFSKKRPFQPGALILSAFFSLFFIVGTCQSVSENTFFSVPFLGLPGTALQYGVCLFFFYVAILLIYEKTEEISGRPEKISTERSRKNLLFSGTAFLLVMWLPYLIAFFPGSLCYDARAQLMQIWGDAPLSNHNPIFDTLVYGALYNLGSFLGRTDNAGVFVIILFQWLLLGSVLGYCVQTVYDITGRPTIRYLLLVFFALNPTFGAAVQVVLKDTVHLAAFVLYYCMLLRLVLLPEEKGQLAKTAVVCMLALLTRKASLPYVVLAGLMTAWYLRKTTGKKLLIVTVSASALFLVCENVMLPLLHVQEAPSRELYSLFIQNVAYITKNHHQELAAHELETIDRLIGLEAILTKYDPNLADPLKNSFTESGTDLLKLNLHLACQYPMDAVRGLLTLCWKYYFPFCSGRAYLYAYMAEVDHLGRNIYFAFPLLQKLASLYVHAWANVPVISLLMGPGFYVWILLFTAMRIARKKQKALIPLMIPLILLTVGLFLTPVNGENRYAYPVITMAPVFLFLSCCSSAPGKSE